jgi:squalene synthase HpnC
VSPVAGQPAAAPSAEVVMARSGGENFPVASRLLPSRERRNLLAIYGYARLVDELGDSYAGDREAALDWLEDELDRAFAGTASHPLLVALTPAIRSCHLTRDPFARLIEANRMDQRVSRYATWEQLRSYCALSANPVGELVLAVFGLSTPARVARSDSVCTGLQLAEHLQDVAEDLAAGRVYLPQEDLARFGCGEDDLRRSHAGPPVQALIAFEVARARRLLDDGIPLVADLRGRPRVAVAAFIGGGRAALRAIERAGHDPLRGTPRATGLARVRETAAVLLAARGAAL